MTEINEDDEIDIIDVASVDLGGDIGVCEMMIYGGEDNTEPHFHLENKDGSFDQSFGIYKMQQIAHDDQKSHELSHEQYAKIYEALLAPHKYLTQQTNWNVCKNVWAVANDSVVDLKAPMPDYRKMKGGE